MKLNLQEIPFSCRGSYLAISQLPDDFKGNGLKGGLYLRSIHGISYIPCKDNGVPIVARMVPTVKGMPVSYEVEAKPHELKLVTEGGEISICFGNTDTLLVRSLQDDFGLQLELKTGYYAHEVPCGGVMNYLCNCAELGRRFMIHPQAGVVSLEQKWHGNYAGQSRIILEPAHGELLAAIEDVAVEWEEKDDPFTYDTCVERVKSEFEVFLDSMPEIPEQYEEARKTAAYINWASIVKADGILTREAMLMSKNWMCNVWSWDHCFNAMALAYHNPQLAWDQLMIMFDYQDETGVIPDSINDVYALHSFCKPPIHGWALSKMMKVMELSREQMEEAYEKLSKWTNWWLNYRDHDKDGICEYNHGNDSGWDNSTAFRICPIMELPDLSAFLILQMDVLSALAEKLGRSENAAEWKQRADNMLSSMLKHNFKDGKPVAVISRTHETVETESLILYLPIVLGKRLPQNIRENMIGELKSERFYTEYGFATESPASDLYASDGYWRGPIWAPSSMIIIDGLYQAGEIELAKEATHKFAEMVLKSGCAENYDALTGVGLRDRAYTWTSSAFLVMTHEYGRSAASCESSGNI